MKHIIKLGMIAIACCCLSGCGNKDAEIARKDRREIKEYSERRSNEITSPRESERVFEDIKKFIDMKRAENFEVWKRAAEKGNPEGQLLLAMCYSEGIGVYKDEAVGANWIRKAAEQGHSEAQITLFGLYLEGHGVPKSEAEAVKWIRKAAEQGDFMAQYVLAGYYREGIGVPKSEAEAEKWIRKATKKAQIEAKKGNTAAQQLLAAIEEERVRNAAKKGNAK